MEIAMNLNKPTSLLNASEKKTVLENLDKAKFYGDPRKVWVEDGHVFLESYDGEIVSMTPAVAIKMGRMLADAGTDSLVNQVMENTEKNDI